jgi:hypothetical protein
MLGVLMTLKAQWLAAAALMAVPVAASSQTLVTDQVFSPNSFWYTPIPANASLHSNSANFVKDFLRQKAIYYQTVNVNTNDYASPVYTANAGTAKVKVTQWDCQKKGYSDANLASQWAAVPIPSYATPSKGTDAEMTIYDPSSNTVWEFWQARKVNGQWQACWGGRMQNVNTNDGAFPGHYGTTATSLPFIGGQITAEELQRGEIKHAIGIALVEVENYTTYSWPAHRSDGYNPNKAPNRIPEGLRFRLDPKINVDALPMSRAGKIIAKAAQKYGFVVWDKAGAISIRAQNVVSYTSQGKSNPYPGLFDGKQNYEVLNGFPWDKLQFMPMNYGKGATNNVPSTPVTTAPTTPAPTTPVVTSPAPSVPKPATPVVTKPTITTPIVTKPTTTVPVLKPTTSSVLNRPGVTTSVVNRTATGASILNQSATRASILQPSVTKTPVVKQPVTKAPVLNQSVTNRTSTSVTTSVSGKATPVIQQQQGPISLWARLFGR